MRTLSILVSILFVTGCAAELPPTDGKPLPGQVDPGGDDDGDGDGGTGDSDGTNDGDGGGSSGQNVCDITQVSNGTERNLSCTSTNGGPATCECRVDGQLVKTCTTDSDSACSMPGGNCCGF